MHNNLALYAIYDKKAEKYIGNMAAIVVFSHDAAAVRFFQDGLTDEKSYLAKHPEDYQLVRLAHLNEKNHIVVTSAEHFEKDNRLLTDLSTQKPEVILDGAAWLATQQPALVKEA